MGDYFDYKQLLVQTITTGYWNNASPYTNLGPPTHIGTSAGVCCSQWHSCVLVAQHLQQCATHSSAFTTCLPAPCQGLAGPWYAQRERVAVKARVQWFSGSMIQMRA